MLNFNPFVIIGIIVAGVFLFQIFSTVAILKLIKVQKNKRDKEFSLIDKERQELQTLSRNVRQDLEDSKNLSKDTLSRLQNLSNQADLEWQNVMQKVAEVLTFLESQSKDVITKQLHEVTQANLKLSKTCRDANELVVSLGDHISKSKKVLQAFDSKNPTDEFLKDIQIEKYEEAKRMIQEGVEASSITKKLGLSLGEVILLSAC